MSIYQHFRPEEREFIDQVQNWQSYVANTYAPKLTDFLDPREQKVLRMIIGENQEVKYAFFGGHEQAERKRAILYPEYYQPMEADFNLSLLEVNYPKKFITIEHPHVLGSLMSLGLNRSKFGDIFVLDGDIQFVVSSEVEDYVRLQLDSIGRAKVTLAAVPLENIILTEEHWTEMTTTITSLRLDAIVAAIYNFSREKAKTYITQGLVKVNFTLNENVSFMCEEGDVFSVRGAGRAMIKSIEGKTKKDKWRIVVGKLK
ncbi:RNA-binding protein [Niallia circulans]|uniref:YlmH family RNA-binding protein n=1 Tax=Niallia circulans TaxID=1397 RepID=UPI00203E20BF|nr:RNA-binding protein [Niallia circulans]MCM2979705.1 RNA-binding protein [Niallia circulans]